MVMQDTSKKAWVVTPNPNPSAKFGLFCFPYAGGGPSIFQSWLYQLPMYVELHAVQPPGRGSRLMEPAYTEIEPLIETLAGVLEGYLDRAFAFFGHSMGALIAFELARYLRQQHQVMPAHLFLSACGAPHIPNPKAVIHTLPEAEFRAELRRLNGTPPEVLEHPELMQLLSPNIRADFMLCERYQYLPESPLDCPITVFGGLQDTEVSRERLERWSEQTRCSFMLRMFPGDHFFVNKSGPSLLSMISQALASVANSSQTWREQ